MNALNMELSDLILFSHWTIEQSLTSTLDYLRGMLSYMLLPSNAQRPVSLSIHSTEHWRSPIFYIADCAEAGVRGRIFVARA